jgi:hypothetical protein
MSFPSHRKPIKCHSKSPSFFLVRVIDECSPRAMDKHDRNKLRIAYLARAAICALIIVPRHRHFGPELAMPRTYTASYMYDGWGTRISSHSSSRDDPLISSANLECTLGPTLPAIDFFTDIPDSVLTLVHVHVHCNVFTIPADIARHAILSTKSIKKPTVLLFVN